MQRISAVVVAESSSTTDSYSMKEICNMESKNEKLPHTHSPMYCTYINFTFNSFMLAALCSCAEIPLSDTKAKTELLKGET